LDPCMLVCQHTKPTLEDWGCRQCNIGAANADLRGCDNPT
jgi:hypothetical protein